MKPRIAIPTPTAGDAEYNAQNWSAYADAVVSSGGEPVHVSLTLNDSQLGQVVAHCDGIVLPGSPADVTTELYGQARGEFTADPDLLRERVDRVLLEDAWSSGKPLLGICFGMQMMNVWRGGTLVQHLMPMPVNHSAGRSVLVAHGIAAEADSRLAEIFRLAGEGMGRGGSVMVNSSHHQAVAIAGDGLRIVARSTEDQVAEAIERADEAGFFVGVQWHPERSFSSSEVSRGIFGGFMDAVLLRSRQPEALARA